MVIPQDQLPLKIKEIRGEQSQAAFAYRFGVTRQLVSQWEAGLAIPATRVLRELNIEKVFILSD